MPFLALAFVVALVLPGCAAPRQSSEGEWQRGQCGQIIDPEAREKCMKRVDSEYGRRP